MPIIENTIIKMNTILKPELESVFGSKSVILKFPSLAFDSNCSVNLIAEKERFNSSTLTFFPFKPDKLTVLI